MVPFICLQCALFCCSHQLLCNTRHFRRFSLLQASWYDTYEYALYVYMHIPYSSINCIKTSKIKRVASESPRASAVSGGHMALPTATAQLSTIFFAISFTYCVPQPAQDVAILYTCKSTKLLLQNPWSASQQACWVCLLL